MMKKLFASTVIVALLSIAIVAQDKAQAPSHQKVEGKTDNITSFDEVLPTSEQQTQFKIWLRQREELQNQINLLDAQINGGLVVLMSQVLHLDPKDGWKPVDDKKGGIKFLRAKPSEPIAPKERKTEEGKQ